MKPKRALADRARQLAFTLALAAGMTSSSLVADQVLRPEDHPGIPAVDIYPNRVVACSEPWLALGLPSTTGATPAPGAPPPAMDSGRVLLWKREDGLWKPKQALTCPDASFATTFGLRVTMDGTRLLAFGSSRTSLRRIFAFRLEGDTWVQDGSLDLQGPGQDHGSFGVTLALSGDLAVVSSTHGKMSTTTAQAGWVDIYERQASGWVYLQRLRDKAMGVQSFGYAVAISGDTIFVSVPSEYGFANSFTEPTGKVSVFEKIGSTWVKTHDIRPPVRNGDFRFGYYVRATGGRLAVTNSHVPSKVYEYSLTPPYALLGHLDCDEAPVDIGGDLAVTVSDTFYRSFKVHRRLPDHTWAQADARESQALDYIGEILVLGEEAFLLGRDPAGEHLQLRCISPLVRPRFEVSGQEISALSQGSEPIHVEARSYAVGHEVESLLTLSASYDGYSAVNVGVALSGDVKGFSFPSSQLRLDPLQKTSLNLRFLPQTAGEKRLLITLTPDLPGASATTFEIKARVQAAPSAPSASLNPATLYSLESSVTLYANVEGTGPFSYRWFRDGELIPGETSSRWKARLPGSYEVEVSSPHGKSRSAPSVVRMWTVPKPQVVAIKGGSAQASVTIFGPGMTVQWLRNGVPLTDGPEFSGTQTPTLTLKNVQANSFLTARMTVQVGSRGYYSEDHVRVSVAPKAPVMTSSLDTNATTRLEEQINHWCRLDYQTPFEYNPPLGLERRFQFSGLPPGVTGDKDGNLEGIPTKTGTYAVQATATVDGFTVSKTFTLKVFNDGITYFHSIAGIYWGFQPPLEPSGPPGVIMVQLTSSGAYSGWCQYGTTRTPVAGGLTLPVLGRSKARPFSQKVDGQPMVFWLQVSSDYLVLEPWLESTTNPSVRRQLAGVSLIKFSSQSSAGGRAGSYNLGLLSPTTDGHTAPAGNGFGTLRILPDDRANYLAQLADGSYVTGSSWLSDGGVDPKGTNVYFYQMDARTRSVLQGNLRFEAATPPAGVMTWFRPAARGRLYPAGFHTLDGEIIASRYALPKNAPLLPGSGHQIHLDVPDSPRAPTPFTLTKGHKAVFGAATANPLKTRLDIYAPTGFFTGQFTLKDPDPASPARSLTRTAHYRGMFLPDHGIAAGYFLLPSLPDPEAKPRTTLTTSPILSGGVLIEATTPPAAAPPAP